MANQVLIAYFSRSGENYADGGTVNLPVGNTEAAAKIIEALTGGTLFKIDPAVPYAASYKECVKEAARDLRNHARPKLTALPESLGDYIILGYPNYCGTMPMPVWTFLESFDFNGKIILPLCTHEGSSMGNSENDLRHLCPTADIRKGLPVRGSSAASSETEIKRWLAENGLRKMGGN